MAHEETLDPITGSYKSVAKSYQAREGGAHPATCPAIHYPGGSRPTPATPSEAVPFAAGEKLESSTGTRTHQSRSPREIAAITVRVAILGGIVWFVLVWTGIATPTRQYQGRAVDFSTHLNARGGPGLPSSFASVIPCAPLQLVIHLGAENEPGPTDVALVQDGMRYAYASGLAKLENRQPVLRVNLDLSQVPAGESQLGIRPAGGEWTYYKVMLKAAH